MQDTATPVSPPPPRTRVGAWLDAATGSPTVRAALAIFLGVVATVLAQMLWSRAGLPGDAPPIVVPLDQGGPKVEPTRSNSERVRVQSAPPQVRIPDGERIPESVVALLPEVAPEPRAGRPPVYRVPPGELVPHAMEVCGAQVAERTDWGVKLLGAPAAWTTTRGKGVRVAVLDTGIDATHPDLRDGIAAVKDFTASHSGPADVQGHGTHCAGVIGARANGFGVVGIAPEASILAGKVLGDDGSGGTAGIAQGIDWAAGQGADVISMSLGGPADTGDIHAAVTRAVAKGVIVVAAAGNDGPKGAVGYPGGLPDCVCVAAVDQGKAVAPFSSRGANVFVAAPGVNVLSTYPGSRLATMSGTSMATPHVAGLAALWCAANPAVAKAARPAAFKAALRAASADLPPPGRDAQSGFGFPSAVALVTKPKADEPPAPNQVYIDIDNKIITAPRGWQIVTPKE